ncbi:VOC family protein [Kiloniella spongiae]|uniref:VOC family protein n=1 Tax=Kiloniella spongiae TaxID=1489064 RepID=UPI00069BB714|nr:VOC family protein [Kiloniella spongiae]
MKRITATHFRVPDFTDLGAFYGSLLGMKVVHQDRDRMAFSFDASQNSLVFQKAEVTAYDTGPKDFYWKIGITVQNLDVVVSYLRERSVVLSDPYQFRDIGYMTKIIDPKGFHIELLQQGFEGNGTQFDPGAYPSGHPIADQAILAHITLRVTDLLPARHYFEKKLGMRLMSIQPVSDRGFCLYFYSWNEENLPDPDLKAVANREWLWRRPYSLIELQHWEDPAAQLSQTPMDQAGFDGFSFAGEGDPVQNKVSFADLSAVLLREQTI